MSKREEVLDKMTKTCVCCGVSRKSIKDSIKSGCGSFEKVCEKTGAGNGSCKGRRCKEKIQEMIEDNN